MVSGKRNNGGRGKKLFKISQDDLEEISDNAYKNFLDGIRSPITKERYTRIMHNHLMGTFDEFLNGTFDERCAQLVDLAKKDPAKVTQLMRSLARKLKERTELDTKNDYYLNPSTIPNHFKPFKKLFTMNEVPFLWTKIDSTFPDINRVSFSKTRGYTKQEIRKMLPYALGSMEKSMPLVLSSSGMRIGALHDLTWNDLTPVYKIGDEFKPYHELLESEFAKSKLACAILIIYKGSSSEGFSFITPEAYESLIDWKSEYKVKLGKTPAGDMPIFCTWKAEFPIKTTERTLSQRIDRMVRKAQIVTTLPKGQRRREVPKTNGFRYYFDKIIKNNASKGSVLAKLIKAEFMMNHTGLVPTDRNYFKSNLMELVEDYVNSVPELSISDVYEKEAELIRQQKENDKLKKTLKEKSKLQNEMDKMEETMKQLSEEMERMNNAQKVDESLISKFIQNPNFMKELNQAIAKELKK